MIDWSVCVEEVCDEDTQLTARRLADCRCRRKREMSTAVSLYVGTYVRDMPHIASLDEGTW